MHSMSNSLARYRANHCKYAEEISSFLHQNPQRNLDHRKLYYILSLYERWWIFVGKHRSEPFERFVLHYIAERAFWSNMQDGEFVAKILVFLYQADRHFSFFVCPERDYYPCFLNQHRDYFSHLTNFSDDKRQLPQFFLNHAYRQQLIICGRRIVDLEVFCRSLWLHPCEMAVVTESPDLLHLLLQYGALIKDEAVSVRRLLSYPETGNITMITLRIVKKIAEIYQRDSWSGPCQTDSERFCKMVLCGRLIVRASPQLERCLLNEDIAFPGFRTLREALQWVATNAISELKYRIYSPLSLKHACRLKIRKLLHGCWQLPYGIDQLIIPTILKGYLNLHYD